jgi:hypothetical protein
MRAHNNKGRVRSRPFAAEDGKAPEGEYGAIEKIDHCRSKEQRLDNNIWEGFGMMVYIPENKYIKEGYYSANDFVALLRESKYDPERFQFLADMLEE